MLNRDIVRLRVLMWLGFFASGTAFSQIPPMPPILPSSPEQCQKFAQQVSEFYAEMRTEHQKCLDDAAKSSKPSPESTQNIMVCSQPFCQYLHNYVYGKAEADSQLQLENCYESVQRRMKEDAEYEERVKERKADEAREENAEKNEVYDSPANSKPHSATPSATTSRPSEQRNEEAAEDSVSMPVTSPQPIFKTEPTLVDPYGESEKTVGTANSSLVDPYAHPASESSSAAIVDPYGKNRLAESNSSLVDPYGREARTETATSRVGKEIGVNSGKKAVGTTFEILEKTLTADIANAPRRLSGTDLQAYLADVNDLKGVMKGMGWMLEKSDYAVDAAAIVKANTDEERRGAEAQLGITFAKDIGTKGISVVATKLFPRAAAVLAGPVGWVAVVGQQVLVPTEMSREPTEIIRDNSGNTTLSQKQEALYQMWRQYQKFGASWKEPQKRELLQNTQTVYEQATAGSR